MEALSRPLVIDFVASARQYRDHVLPVWQALPPEMRGAFFTRPELKPPGLDTLPRSDRAGVGDLVLVAGYIDLVDTQSHHRPTIFMEHGAGLRFPGASWAGSPRRPNVTLFLCPNEFVAGANRATHPFTPVEVVGCPKLDTWHRLRAKPRARKPVVAFTFHWDCRLAGGTRSAFPHFRTALADLKRCADFDVIGTAHPRYEIEVAAECLKLAIPFEREFKQVVNQADLLIFDVTSAGYEFASLDRPVVVLDAPWYAGEPDRGIRFWQAVPGPRVSEPEKLVPVVRQALEDPESLQLQRRTAINAVYPHRGDAAERAVVAIRRFIDSC